MSGYNRDVYQQNYRNNVSIQRFEDAPYTYIFSGFKNFLVKHYVFTTFWILGLVIISLATGINVDDATNEKFFDALDHANDISDTIVRDAEQKLFVAKNRYYNSKGWFTCDSYCENMYQKYLKAQSDYKKTTVKCL